MPTRRWTMQPMLEGRLEARTPSQETRSFGKVIEGLSLSQARSLTMFVNEAAGKKVALRIGTDDSVGLPFLEASYDD